MSSGRGLSFPPGWGPCLYGRGRPEGTGSQLENRNRTDPRRTAECVPTHTTVDPAGRGLSRGSEDTRSLGRGRSLSSVCPGTRERYGV